MKRLTLFLVSLLFVGYAVAGCGAAAPRPGKAEDGAAGSAGGAQVDAVAPSVPAPPSPPEPRPQSWQPPALPTRDEWRDQLLKMVNGAGSDVAEQLKAYGAGANRRDDPFFQAADLDGDGQTEYVLTLPVSDGSADPFPNNGAALFVVYQVGGHWAVDRSDPMSAGVEHSLMAPGLLGVADLAGAGHPQIVWYRPEGIATGPQPYRVFVTAWRPGSFTNLPGEMAICATMKPFGLAIDGKELVLTGVSRTQWFVRLDAIRTDRYRFIDGVFRLVDRHFLNHPEFGYDRFWDGLVAEGVGRTADAMADFRAAAEPAREAHPGSYEAYHQMPHQLTEAEMAQFAAALRPFARFRLGGLLLQAGRKAEAQEVLKPTGTPYDGLTEAMRTAPDRETGCKAATAWAKANPQFLAAVNVGAGEGVGHIPWTPELLCGYTPLEERSLKP